MHKHGETKTTRIMMATVRLGTQKISGRLIFVEQRVHVENCNKCIKNLCITLVIGQGFTKMHGQRNIKKSTKSVCNHFLSPFQIPVRHYQPNNFRNLNYEYRYCALPISRRQGFICLRCVTFGGVQDTILFCRNPGNSSSPQPFNGSGNLPETSKLHAVLLRLGCMQSVQGAAARIPTMYCPWIQAWEHRNLTAHNPPSVIFTVVNPQCSYCQESYSLL